MLAVQDAARKVAMERACAGAGNADALQGKLPRRASDVRRGEPTAGQVQSWQAKQSVLMILRSRIRDGGLGNGLPRNNPASGRGH